MLQIKNRSDENPYVVSGSLHVETVTYTGRERDEVKVLHFEKELAPSTMEIVELELDYNEYSKKLFDQVSTLIFKPLQMIITMFL